MRKQHRIAIIGLGMVLRPHLQSLLELADRAEIAACHTPSAARQAAFRAAHPQLPLVADLDRVLADPSIDAAIILSPPNTHLALVERCARAGKHVLLEKPIEGTLARSELLVAIMEQAGLRLGIVLQYRFRSVTRRMEEALASGALGALISASAQVRWWRGPDYFAQAGRGIRARDGGGVLLTQAIHTLDLFQHLAGGIVRVAAMARTSPLRRIDTEDIACAAVELGNGAIGSIDATTVSYPGFAERIELACEHGTMVMSAEDLDIWWKDGRHERFAGPPSNAGGANPMAYTHDAHKGVIADFLDALDEGRAPRVSGREALKVHRLIDAVLKSSTEGRAVECGASTINEA
jgi:predicted dehydrogenase